VPSGEWDALGRRRNTAPDEMVALLAEAGVHPSLAHPDGTYRRCFPISSPCNLARSSLRSSHYRPHRRPPRPCLV
jgi:hypothetical protein